MKNLPLALACAIAMTSAACVESLETDDPASTTDDPEPLPDDTIVYDTVATMGPDGQVVMSEPRPITVREQRAQNDARLSTTPSVIYSGYTPIGSFGQQDYGCAYDSLWVYSRTDFTGDRICFSGQYYIFHMGDYSRFTVINGHTYYAGTWRIPSGSYLVGIRNGAFWSYNAATTTWTSRKFTTSAYAGTFSFAAPLDNIQLD